MIAVGDWGVAVAANAVDPVEMAPARSAAAATPATRSPRNMMISRLHSSQIIEFQY
jgi:hypothetical protein